MGDIRINSSCVTVVSVMRRLMTVNKINDTIIGRFNTGIKSRYIGTIMMEAMEVMKKFESVVK